MFQKFLRGEWHEEKKGYLLKIVQKKKNLHRDTSTRTYFFPLNFIQNPEIFISFT